MDPDPSSLYNIFLSQPFLSIDTFFYIFLILLISVVLYVLFWVSLVERYLTNLDIERVEEFEQNQFKSYKKLSFLYQRSNRFSVMFSISKLVLAIFITVTIYFILQRFNLNLFLDAGIIFFPS